MAMELIGAEGLANGLKQFYDKKLLVVAEQNLVFLNYGQQKDIPPAGGKSIEFRRYEKITVGSHVLTEGTPPTMTQATISTVTCTISQYGAYSQISDILETQNYDPIIAEYSDKYGIHMAETLDEVVRDVLVAGTTVQYASTSTSIGNCGSGMYLNSAELAEARRTLRRANAKPSMGNKYIVVVHPDNTKDLYDDTDIVNAFKDAAPRDTNNPLFTGVLGDWMGFTFVESTHVRVSSSLGLSGADVYSVLVLGSDAYGITKLSAHQARMIIHPRGSGGHSDPLEQYSTIGWKAALAASRLNENFMVRIECNSSYKTAA